MALVRVKCSLLLTLPPSLKLYFLLEKYGNMLCCQIVNYDYSLFIVKLFSQHNLHTQKCSNETSSILSIICN